MNGSDLPHPEAIKNRRRRNHLQSQRNDKDPFQSDLPDMKSAFIARVSHLTPSAPAAGAAAPVADHDPSDQLVFAKTHPPSNSMLGLLNLNLTGGLFATVGVAT
jgi:hypothetical protein